MNLLLMRTASVRLLLTVISFQKEGIRCRMMSGVGKGKLVPSEKLTASTASITVIKEGGHLGRTFWSEIGKNEDVEEKTADSEGESEEDEVGYI